MAADTYTQAHPGNSPGSAAIAGGPLKTPKVVVQLTSVFSPPPFPPLARIVTHKPGTWKNTQLPINETA